MPVVVAAAAPVVLAVDPFSQWFERHGDALVSVPLRILLIVALAVVLRVVAGRLISRAAKRLVSAERGRRRVREQEQDTRATKNEHIIRERREQRGRTIASVLRSTASIVIFTVAAMVILGELGISLGPIIASAGIIGLAVGFGAQSLVSDVIAGMFMLIEDQYGVGDWVDVGDASGEVEVVGLRVTQVRDGNGVLWFVRNGEITRVGNHSQDWARVILDVPIAYDEDIDRVSELLTATARALSRDPDHHNEILEEPEVWGMSSLSSEAVVVQLAVVTAPLQQWGVARELRQRIKAAFDEQGIRIPLPQQTIWYAEHPPATATGPGPGDGSRVRHGED